MLVYEKIMTSEEVEDLYGDFFSKDWKDIPIDPEILSWTEISFIDNEDGTYTARAILNKDRVYAGVLLRNRGFSVDKL